MSDEQLLDLPPSRKSTKQVWFCRKAGCDERQDLDIYVEDGWHEVNDNGRKTLHKMDKVWEKGLSE